METDPLRMLETMIGIPGARVLEIYQEDEGLRVELETSTATAVCPICRGEGELDGLCTVDLGVHSSMGQPVHLEWVKRQWRCPSAACRARSWTESDKGFEEFLARSPHRRADRSEQ